MTGPVRLTIVCAVLLSVAIVIGASFFLFGLRNRILAENERNLSNTALLLAKQIEHIFTAAESVQKTIIAQTPVYGIIGTEDFEHRLSGYDFHLKLRDNAAGMPYVGSLTVINAQGRLINFSRQWPIPNIDASDRDFFKALQTDPNLTSFLSEPIRNRATGTWVMQYARKISGPNREFLGLITAAIELQSIQNSFMKIAIEPDSGLVLLREDGTLFARIPKFDSDIGRRFPNAPPLKLVSTTDHGVGVSKAVIDGLIRVIAAHRVGGYPVVVAASKTLATIFADWRRTAAYVIGISTLSIVIIAAFAFLFIRLFRSYQALVKARAEREKSEQLREQSLRFDVAVSNMSQGLLMFDASSRIVVCNERYLQMYDLSPEIVKPGLTLFELIKHRAATGSFDGDPQEYCSSLLDRIAKRQLITQSVETAHGRTIHVVSQPMADGGWVATHEDITELVRREESFRLLFEGNPVPMWVFDRESLRFLAVNDAAVTHYGYSREQFLAMTVPDLRPTKDRERFTHFLRTLSDDQPVENIGQHRKSDGTIIDIAACARALTYAGRKARLVAIRDITKAKLAEDELRRTKKFLNTVIENVPHPILVKEVSSSATDARDCRFTLINRAFEEIMGVPRDQIIGKTTHGLYPKDRADRIVEHDTKTLQSDQTVSIYEHLLVTPGNGTRLVTAKKVAIRDTDEKPQYLLTVLDDVTEQRRTEERILYLAHNDSLTDLPNRATFIEYFSATLDKASKTGEQFAILSIDLDRFKEANDVYGHTIGDALLCEAGRRLKVAAGGAFLARIGGDEFMLIVTDGPQPAAAEALSVRLLAAFRDDFEVDGHRLKLGLSIGGAVYPTDGTDAKTLMINADAALYRAKAETRGSVWFFEAEMGARLRERRDLQNDLRSAVGRGELFLHYQPQKKMTGETIGFEALVRWQCPKRGMVAPGAFIPIAEESDLIIPLGEWALREACREAVSWPKPLTIAVNISPIQFRYGDLPRLVHSILLETGLTPARLELEITEGVLIDDFSRAVSILRRLKSLGVQIAMDDFGTGYSSMSYLHAFPFDKIKIDRTFIGDLEHNRHSMAIVRAVIGLGHSLDVPILAEGVETEAQHKYLLQEGCDEVQGYLTGRPLPIEDYAELIGHPAIAKQNYAAAG